MNLPPYENIKTKKSKTGRTLVFDFIRHRYVTFTPEEMVRQFFLNFLVTYKGYPAALLGNEVELHIGEKKVRCDSVLYGKDMLPRMIIEYKAPDIEITEKVLNQILAYNTQLNVQYLIMSNGTQHVAMKFDRQRNKWLFLPEIPNYQQL